MRAAWAVLACLAAAPALAQGSLFSPGELSKAHAGLEGLSQCTKCHPAGGQLDQQTCLTCHTELQPRLGKGLGLHGRIPTEKRACEGCHSEHKGVGFALVDWGAGGQKGFNHLRAGWPLKGKHQEVKCLDCHEKRLILSAPVKKLQAEKRPQTLLGLGTACADCHFDDHRGQLKQDCDYCHVEKDWKPAPGFNHDETEYPLRGKHKKVKCAGCHDAEKDGEAHGFPKPTTELFLRFAPVEHRTCLDCHKDFHDGKFGPRCQSCHTVEGWHLIRNAATDLAFHQKTDFPLKGAHLDVACKACHGGYPGVKSKFKGVPHATCASCHADAHEGQLSTNGKGPDCATCHDEQSFLPARYGMSEHAKSRYPLEGAHQVVACASCHPATPALKARVPKPVLVDLRRRHLQELFSLAALDVAKPLERCESCHADVHQGQFKDQPCTRCHQVASFASVRFDHRQDSRFPLEGAHAKVACEKCHYAPSATEAVRYKPLATQCKGCHLDVHAGQFGAKPCERCHQNESWKALTFQHQPPFTTFLLDGQHAKARCEACHRPVTVASGVKATQYRPLPTTCEGCHSDFHKGEFAGFEP